MKLQKIKSAILIAAGALFGLSFSSGSIVAQEPASSEQALSKAEPNKKNGATSTEVELKKHFPTKQLEKGEDVKWTHAPYNKGKCSLCHETDDLEKPGPMRASVNRICLSCHAKEKKKLKRKKVIHKPVAKDCGYCHNAHNSKYKSLLYRPMEELCVTCHKEQKVDIESKVSHEPVVKQKMCKHCHDSHASNIEKRLFLPEDKLCVDACHGSKKVVKDEKGRVLANIKKLQKKKVKHGPFGEKNCSECHKSHGSKHFRLLTASYPDEFYATYRENTYAFCFKCHKKERITTPKTTTLTGFRKKDVNLHYAHVVKPESGRSCRSCHEDHATEGNHLVRASVPYGPEGWALELNYVETKKGGKCSKTCHDNETYNNQGSRPNDVAREYKRKREKEKRAKIKKEAMQHQK